MSLTLSLGAAMSGLLTAQKGLDLTSHNIANVNTEGFTRKNFNPTSQILYGRGVGVQVGQVTRDIDQGLLKDIRREGGILDKLETYSDYYQRLQDLFGTPEGNTSIAHSINAIAAEFENLAIYSSKSTSQTAAVDAADQTMQRFNSLSEQLQELRRQADTEISTAVDTVSDLLSEVNTLNDNIVRDTATGRGTADLEDQRDLALKKLSSMLDIQVFSRGNGAIVVYTASGTSLVDNSAVTVEHSALTVISPWQNTANGDFDEISVGTVDITAEIRQGKLKSLIDLRDTVLPDLQAEMDELARALRDEMNRVHNRGTSFPTLTTSATGTRAFLDSASQTVDISGEVRLLLFDSNGAQVANDSLSNLGLANPATIDQVATALNTFFTSVGAGGSATIDADGKLAITAPTGYGFAIRDEVSTTDNTQSDATLQFNADADAGPIYEESVKGFSNFFGLNDFLVTDRKNWVWQSDLKASSSIIGAAGTLAFSDETNGLNFATISVIATDKLSDIADKINNDATLKVSFQAEVVPEGGSYRLRVKHLTGEEMQITQTGASTVMDALGIEKSTVGLSSLIEVREEIRDSPQKIARNAPQYSTDLNAYFLSVGDNTTANELAGVFTSNVSFNLAGGLSGTTRVLSDYAGALIAQSAADAANVTGQLTYQKGLHQALELKSAEVSAVNLDEELAKLMVFEQAYAAAAKVIQTTQQMLDILNDLIR